MKSELESGVDFEADKFDAEMIRADFPIFKERDPREKPLIFLDNASSTQKPTVVIEREEEVYSRYYANAYRGVYDIGNKVDRELEETREKLRALINADRKEEIIFTSGTTMSLNLVAHAWGEAFLQPGDEIVLSEMEHHANIVPWQMVAKKTGAKLVFVRLTDDFQIDGRHFEESIGDQTKIVAITSMSNVLGTKPDLRKIIAAAHSVHAIVVVDAAQSIAHDHVDVTDLDVDFLAFSGHKMFGPSGVGVLYGKYDLLDEMDPFLGGGHMIDRVTTTGSTWAKPPAKYEAGTLPIAQAIALGAAVDYLTEMDLDSLRRHEDELFTYAMHALNQIPGFQVYGPTADDRGAIISFTLAGAHPEDLAQLLNMKGVCVRHGHHCTMPLHDKLGLSATVRASFAAYNTRDDVDQFLEAVQYARTRLRLN